MRLYTRTGATTVDDPEYGHFDANPDGGFDLPEELAERLHAFHAAGQRLWENDIERQNRLIAEELERRKDPATLLSVVEQLMQAAQVAQATATPAKAETEADAPAAKPTRARKATNAAK